MRSRSPLGDHESSRIIKVVFKHLSRPSLWPPSPVRSRRTSSHHLSRHTQQAHLPTMSACDHSGSGTLDSPPPAYEYSEQDYDKKLAEATEQSLRLSEHQNRSSINAHILHEEDWNERQISTKLSQDKSFQSRSNASLEPVRPLNIKKKSRASTTSLDITNEKEKPSWYNEAQLGGASAAPTSSTTQRRALPIPGAYQRPLSAQSDYRREYNEEAKSSPLSFTAVNKSLDGPPYERFSSDKATGPVMMLHGEHRALSPPLPSRSASPITNAQIRSRAVTPQSGSISNGYHYAQQPTSFQPRSSGKQQTAFNQSAPRMNFDPSVAYENTKASSTRYSKLPTESYEDKAQNAAALYR